MKVSVSTRLPEGWQLLDCHEERIVVGIREATCFGIAVRTADGTLVSGSSVAIDQRQDLARRKAESEFYERAACLLRSPGARYSGYRCDGSVVVEPIVEVIPGPGARLSRSNGVAAHPLWSEASLRARCEQVERDAVLRSWFGGHPPQLIEGFLDQLLGLRFRVYRIPSLFGFHVCFAMVASEHAERWLFGFGCRPNLAEAREHAIGEALQRLIFLDGESCEEDLEGSSDSPMFHQAFYLQPQNFARIEDWLSGKNQRPNAVAVVNESMVQWVDFDITPKEFRGCTKIVRAVGTNLLPLTFGDSRGTIPWSVPQNWPIHPIA